MISLFLFGLFVLRGDLFSYLYVLALLCLGPLSPLALPRVFADSLISLIVFSVSLRFLVQTPIVCQSTSPASGAWRLFFAVPRFLKLPSLFSPIATLRETPITSSRFSFSPFSRLSPRSSLPAVLPCSGTSR